ncbi:hypothetical protein LXL04_018409 [Taraxacum kok-saghyz]
MQKLKKISFFRKFFSANFIHSKRFGGFRSRFFERNNGLGDIGNWGSSRKKVKNKARWIELVTVGYVKASEVTLFLSEGVDFRGLEQMASSYGVEGHKRFHQKGNRFHQRAESILEKKQFWNKGEQQVCRRHRGWQWMQAEEEDGDRSGCEKEADAFRVSSKQKRESRSFENSYIPENPRTPKPLHICKKKFRAYVHVLRFCFKNAQIPEIFLKFFYRSLYTTYLKGFVKKNLKKNAKKKVAYMQKLKKKVAYMQKLKKISFFRKFFSANFIHSKRFGGFRSRFFERNNGLGDIGNWGSSRVLGNI